MVSKTAAPPKSETPKTDAPELPASLSFEEDEDFGKRAGVKPEYPQAYHDAVKAAYDSGKGKRYTGASEAQVNAVRVALSYLARTAGYSFRGKVQVIDGKWVLRYRVADKRKYTKPAQ